MVGGPVFNQHGDDFIRTAGIGGKAVRRDIFACIQDARARSQCSVCGLLYSARRDIDYHGRTTATIHIYVRNRNERSRVAIATTVSIPHAYLPTHSGLFRLVLQRGRGRVDITGGAWKPCAMVRQAYAFAITALPRVCALAHIASTFVRSVFLPYGPLHVD